MNGRELLMQTFDELYEAALARLQATCTDDERAEARRRFEERFRTVLDATENLDLPAPPPTAVAEMRTWVQSLSAADLAGLVATVPLVRQTQAVLKTLARRDAERRLIEQLAMQADTRWGN